MKVQLIAMMVATAVCGEGVTRAESGIPKTCRTVIARAGLGDYCCPPTGLAKLWGNIPGNKEIHWVQGSQHGCVPPAYEGRDFVREQK